MVFHPGAETVVTLAFWTGAAALALTGTFLLWILSLRLWSVLQNKLRQRALLRWRPVLMSSLYEQPDTLPRLSRIDLPHVLELWNHLHDSLSGEARSNLDQMAGQARIPAAVSRMLRKKNFYARLLAVRTAGNLRLASACDLLRELLWSDSPALSLAAARALTQIDSARAVPLLMPCLTGRSDWHPGAVMEVFHLAGAGQLVNPLFKSIATAPADQAPQLIRYLAEIAPVEAALLVSRILASSSDEENLLIVCLDLLNDSEELETVRALAHHTNWHVRVHAAKALGRFGTLDDLALLTDMLLDSQWWVRYRAAQSLSLLPGLNSGELLHIKDIQTDRDARDMLHQVMAERELQPALLAVLHG